MPGEPSMLSTAKLATLLGLTPRGVRHWMAEDATLAGCVLRQTRRSTWWSVQRLRDRGFLTKPDTKPAAPQAQAVAS